MSTNNNNTNVITMTPNGRKMEAMLPVPATPRSLIYGPFIKAIRTTREDGCLMKFIEDPKQCTEALAGGHVLVSSNDRRKVQMYGEIALGAIDDLAGLVNKKQHQQNKNSQQNKHQLRHENNNQNFRKERGPKTRVDEDGFVHQVKHETRATNSHEEKEPTFEEKFPVLATTATPQDSAEGVAPVSKGAMKAREAAKVVKSSVWGKDLSSLKTEKSAPPPAPIVVPRMVQLSRSNLLETKKQPLPLFDPVAPVVTTSVARPNSNYRRDSYDDEDFEDEQFDSYEPSVPSYAASVPTQSYGNSRFGYADAAFDD
jgi:hypothetical protein